ncbi:RNA polymerase recycling motor ATPase HelR [Paeniglutamicibacter sp.]|uniref:RNA polymerase recycling motor ATPase HelR n=1 Tax=Paeniglutamicibacter sp. TaxID=1934391 RepID=UPI00398988EB
MNPLATSAFALPGGLAAKSDPLLVGGDERHFGTIAASLGQAIKELSTRLDAVRKAPGQLGQEALERDMEVHRLTARLRALRRFGMDLCLGRMVGVDDPEPIYVGRLGLTDPTGRRLLIDWRSPAAEPFFAATHAHPMGLASRRRYHWRRGRVIDYWDEVFTADGLESNAALDDQSAFIASLGINRSARMRDVVGTIQADQDAIIRAPSRGALVVDGGPGTGKTVVALHRSAYLLYSDPRIGHHRGGVLFIGPHQPYLAYVADVLPSLGEEGVQVGTLRDLLPEGAGAAEETDPDVAALKSTVQMVKAVATAVGFFQEPPAEGMVVETEFAEPWLDAGDWAEAFEAAEPGTPHNEARGAVRDALIELLVQKHDADVPAQVLRKSLLRNRELAAAFDDAWPVLEPASVIGGMWTVPTFLAMCAPWLNEDKIRLLQRADGRAWTASDLPLLDAARQLLGDPEAARQTRSNHSAPAGHELMDRVIDDLVASDDSELMVMSMLRGEDLQEYLFDQDETPGLDPDELAGPFAHIVVDEAQELTDAQWQMLLSRCPSGSFTVVGDRAQARAGFTESWEERLSRVGLGRVTMASLSINYRTPAEVMEEAEAVIRDALPDANVPVSIRTGGPPVRHGRTSELAAILEAWLAGHPDGAAAVIGDPAFTPMPRVGSLTPQLAKGLEFDLVVLVDPEAFGDGIQGAVDRYVAMTRATGQLVILTDS